MCDKVLLVWKQTWTSRILKTGKCCLVIYERLSASGIFRLDCHTNPRSVVVSCKAKRTKAGCWEHCLRRHGFEICRIVLNAEVFLVNCVPGVCLTSGIVRSSLFYSCCLFSWVEFREMPVEAGATVGEDTTQPVPPNEKNAPVVNGNNVETLPKGIGKQVFNVLVSVTGICFFFYRGGRAFVSRWSMHLFG